MSASILSRLEFAPPTGWRDLSVLTFVQQAAKSFAANLVVTHAPLDGADLGAHVEAEALAFEKELPAYRRIGVERMAVAGASGYAVEQTFATDSGTTLRQLALYFVVEDSAVTLSLTHRDDEFDTVRPRFHEIVRSLAIRS